MEPSNIKFLKILSLRGPNLWTYHPVLEVWVDIGIYEDFPSNTIPGFVDRLCEWLPTLEEHRCSYCEAGGFIKRLREGTWAAHILEHVTLELQDLAGIPGGFGKARETGVRGIYKVAVRAPHEEVTRVCLVTARDLILAAMEDRPFDVAAAHEQLREVAKKYLLGPTTACIVDAATAKDRRIPAIRLSSDNLVQLGYGSSQRRIWRAQTELTGAIAEGISRDPEFTGRLLATCGIPIPERHRAYSEDEALEAADDIGLPVIVKPVSFELAEHATLTTTKEEVTGAFRKISEFTKRIMVEQIMPGDHYRLLVVGGKLAAAARLDGGTGVSNIPKGAADVTARIHPATASAACLAAKIVGLDIAGVDVMLEDVSAPLSLNQGAITAVHAGPGLITHIQPVSGVPQPVGRAIVDGLFPNGDCGRIPVVGITGTRGSTEVARVVAELLRLSGKHTGLACRDGLFVDGRQVETCDCGNWQSGRRVLMNRCVNAAVLENSADIILGEGLAYDRCLVGIVTNIVPEEHYGRFYIDTAERVIQVMRTQVDVVLPEGVSVLNAADSRVVELASLSDGEVLYFAIDPSLPVIEAHRQSGGRAVFVRGQQLILATAAAETRLVPLSSIPFISGNDKTAKLDSVLAAVAGAWALGIPHHVLRTGVETFSANVDDLNRLETSDPSALR